MKIYVCNIKNADDATAYRLKIVHDTLNREGVSVVDRNSPIANNGSGDTAMSGVSGFIFDTACKSKDLAYLLAFAVLQKKPVLFIHASGDPVLALGDYLDVDSTSDLVVFSQGDLMNLANEVEKFVQDKITSVLASQDAPTIKFTLRISPRLERYLDQKSQELHVSKADFLRRKAEEMIGGDISKEVSVP